MIDHRFEERVVSGQVAVDATLPSGLTSFVELLLMAMLKETFALAVADLLSPISSDRIAMMMPDERRGAEGQMPAALLQSPADVHVVTGLGVGRIEAPQLLERPTAKGHVTSGNVLGDRVVKEHVRRAAWTSRDALRNPAVVFRRDIRPAHADGVGRQERLNEVRKPVRVNARIGVGVGDDLSRRRSPAQIARGA